MIVQDSPSLKVLLDASLQREYQIATKQAVDGTGLSGKNFPAECPYAFEQILNEEFWRGSQARLTVI